MIPSSRCRKFPLYPVMVATQLAGLAWLNEIPHCIGGTSDWVFFWSVTTPLCLPTSTFYNNMLKLYNNLGHGGLLSLVCRRWVQDEPPVWSTAALTRISFKLHVKTSFVAEFSWFRVLLLVLQSTTFWVYTITPHWCNYLVPCGHKWHLLWCWAGWMCL